MVCHDAIPELRSPGVPVSDLFRMVPRACACRTERVDTTDIIKDRALHGLFHCFALTRAGRFPGMKES